MTEKELDNLEEDESNETLDWDNSPKEEDVKAKRHAQQMEWSRLEVERLERIAFESQRKLAETDANNLLELHKTDPKLAEKVAKSFNYWSFEEARQVIIAGNVIEQKPEDDFEVKYSRKRAEERHQEALEDATKFIKKSKLDDEKREAAQNYFDKITAGKQLTRDEALEYADMATLYVQKENIKEWKYQEWLKELQSSWLSSKKVAPSKNTWPQFVVRNGEMVELLPSNNWK